MSVRSNLPRPSVPDRQEAILAALRACPLYFILDESLLAMHDPLKLTRSVVKAGVRMLQVRLKSNAAELTALTKRVTKATAGADCLVIVNDSLDAALQAGADGVHLGRDDLTVEEARRLATDLIIGATARTPVEAWQAEVAGADYIGCGSVFGSITKPGLPVVGLAGLAAVNHYVSIPVVAIGGITAENCGSVMASRVAGFCSVAPFLRGDAGRTVQELVTAANLPTILE